MPRVTMALRSNVVSVGSILTKLQQDCATPFPVIRHMADSMTADMRAGLAVDGGSNLKMILSYVDSLPSGYFQSQSLMLFVLLYLVDLFSEFYFYGM